MTVQKESVAVSDRIWYEEYPQGVPHKIGDVGFHSVADMLRQSCMRAANKTAFYSLGKAFSYKKLDETSNQLAAYMQHEMGLKKGDRLAIMLPNLIQYPVAMFAAMKLGLVVVNINPLYTPTECEHQINDAGCVAIIVLGNFAHTIEEIYHTTSLREVIVTNAGDMIGVKGALINGIIKYVKRDVKPCHIANITAWKSIFKHPYRPLTPVHVEQNDIAFLQYTGGTTGVSKGAVLTHRNILCNVLQGVAWMTPICESGKEIVVGALPMYHIFSLTVCCFCFMYLQGSVLLVVNPRDTKSFIRDLKRHKATAFMGLNTLFISLMKYKSFRSLDFSSYKITLSGGMKLQESVAEQWQKVTGIPVIEGYGLTETSPMVSVSPVNCGGFNGSIGVPLPSTDVEVRNAQGGKVAQGEAGELCVRGPQVMQGYWHNSKATASAIDSAGWFHTGDIGYFDERGYLYLIDRKKDMIIVSGFNVYPTEVESVISSHPMVEEVAVVGEHCEKTGELIKAFVVALDDKLTKSEVINFCRQRITAYKIPKQVEFVEELPKSNVGKVLRRSLRKTH